MELFYQALSKVDNHAGEEFDPKTIKKTDSRVLIVGAGGIGCEVIKNLVMMGVYEIDIVDMDRIDLSNLNRQFLFRDTDIGNYKSDTAVKRLMEIIKGRDDEDKFHMNSFTCPIQDFSLEKLSEYFLVVTALDNIEARRWVNRSLFDLLTYDEDGNANVESMIPLVDGGSEGLLGQARLIVPGLPIPCYECTLYLTEDSRAIPLCTMAHTPRNPEHCIEWARLVAWNNIRPDDIFDVDNSQHTKWVHDQALTRAHKFNITPFEFFETIGIIKRIVPAVSSTNALVSGFISNIVLRFIIKHATNFDGVIGDSENYVSFCGDTAVILPQQIGINEDCNVCRNREGNKPIELSIIEGSTLEHMIESLRKDPLVDAKCPTITKSYKSEQELIWSSLKMLKDGFTENLPKKVSDLQLFQDDVFLQIDDPNFKKVKYVKLIEQLIE